MSEWNIPENLDVLFSDVPASYQIIDSDFPGDNIEAMRLFIDNVPGLEEFIVVDDGTQIQAERNGVTIFIDCGGLGDFHMHGYDVSFPEQVFTP